MDIKNKKLNDIIGRTRIIFDQDGFINPICFLIDKENKGIILPGNFSNDTEKDIFSFTIQKICSNKKIVELILITESWIKKFDTKNNNVDEELENFKNTGKRISEYKDKEEVIMINHETKLSSDMYLIPIIRNGNKATLGKLEKMEGISSKGRFCGFLYSDNIEKVKH